MSQLCTQTFGKEIRLIIIKISLITDQRWEVFRERVWITLMRS
jgi:hypothetical protein